VILGKRKKRFVLQCVCDAHDVGFCFCCECGAAAERVAPVTVPPGGFSIEGDLSSDLPAVTGDWVPGNNGQSSAVLSTAGVAVNPATTFHFKDPFDPADDLIFSGGLKWDDSPSKWTWTTGKANAKTELITY